MYLSSNDGVDGVDVDSNSNAQQGNTPPISSEPSQTSSPSCPTLLVIDDNSSSNDPSLNSTDIPSTAAEAEAAAETSSNAQSNQSQAVVSSPTPAANDTTNDTPEQQRRRNSSIAKLLGGHPLNNQQYEEINQQILDDQSAQNGLNHNDNGTDSGIPRSRSSITRTLLANAEKNNSNSNTNSTSTNNLIGRPQSPDFSKNFEYLIRRELDIEHAPSPLHPGSIPNIFPNLTSVRNTPPARSSSPSQSKLKRKRSNPKQNLPITSSNKSSTNSPFALREPFELDTSGPPLLSPLNSTVQPRSHHQNALFRFDASHRHSRPLQQQQQQQPPPQFPIPMKTSSANSPAYSNPKMSPSVFSQFTIHSDRLPSTPSSSSSSGSSSSSYNFCHYTPTNDLPLSTPVSALSSHPSISQSSSAPLLLPHSMGSATRKIKSMHRPNLYDTPVQRPHSITSSQPHSSSPSSPSGHSAPLKKRLLHAYNNEHHPSSSSL